MRTKTSDLEVPRLTLALAVTYAAQYLFIIVLNVVNLNGVTCDLGSNFDLVNHQYICPETGYYFCHGVNSYGGLGGNWNAAMYTGIGINGNVVTVGAVVAQTSANGYLDGEVTDVVACNKNDKLTLLTLITTGWALNPNNIFMTIYKVA